MSKFNINDKIIVIAHNKPGIIRYNGDTSFASGTWLGIELEDNTGKHNGTVNGVTYFNCQDLYGIFVKPSAVKLATASASTSTTKTTTTASAKTKLDKTKTIPSSAPSSRPTTPSTDITDSNKFIETSTPIVITPQISNDNIDLITDNKSEIISLIRSNSKSDIKELEKALSEPNKVDIPEVKHVLNKSDSKNNIVKPSSTSSRLERKSYITTEIKDKDSSKIESSKSLTTTDKKSTFRSAVSSPKSKFESSKSLTTTDKKSTLRSAVSSPKSKFGYPSPIASNLLPPIDIDDKELNLEDSELSQHTRKTSLVFNSENHPKTPAREIRSHSKPEALQALLEKRSTMMLSTKKRSNSTLSGDFDIKAEDSVSDESKVEFEAFKTTALETETHLKSEIAKLKQSLSELKQNHINELNEAHVNLNESTKVTEKLLFDKLTLGDKIDTMQKELTELRVRNEELEVDLQIVKEEQELNKEELISNLPTDVQKIAEIVENNNKLSDALRKMRDVATAETTKWEGKVNSIQIELLQVMATNSKLKELESLPFQLKKSQQEVEELKEALDDAQGFEKMVEQLTEKNLSLGETLTELKKSHAILENVVSINEEVEQEQIEFEKQLQSELRQSELHLMDLQTQITQKDQALDVANKSIKQFKNLVSNLQEDIANLTDQISKQSNTSKEQSDKSRLILDKNMELLNRLQELRNKNVHFELLQFEGTLSNFRNELVKQYIPISSNSPVNELLIFHSKLVGKLNIFIRLLAMYYMDSGDSNLFMATRMMHLLCGAERWLQHMKWSIYQSDYSILESSRFRELVPFDRLLDSLIQLVSSDSLNDYPISNIVDVVSTLHTWLVNVNISPSAYWALKQIDNNLVAKVTETDIFVRGSGDGLELLSIDAKEMNIWLEEMKIEITKVRNMMQYILKNKNEVIKLEIEILDANLSAESEIKVDNTETINYLNNFRVNILTVLENELPILANKIQSFSGLIERSQATKSVQIADIIKKGKNIYEKIDLIDEDFTLIDYSEFQEGLRLLKITFDRACERVQYIYTTLSELRSSNSSFSLFEIPFEKLKGLIEKLFEVELGQLSTEIPTLSINTSSLPLQTQFKILQAEMDDLISRVSRSTSSLSHRLDLIGKDIKQNSNVRWLTAPSWEIKAEEIKQKMIDGQTYKTQLEALQKQLLERTQQLFTAEKNLREEQFKIEALQARSKQILDKSVEDSYESKLLKMEAEHKAATDQHTLDLQKAFKEIALLKSKLVNVIKQDDSESNFNNPLSPTSSKGKLLALLNEKKPLTLPNSSTPVSSASVETVEWLLQVIKFLRQQISSLSYSTSSELDLHFSLPPLDAPNAKSTPAQLASAVSALYATSVLPNFSMNALISSDASANDIVDKKIKISQTEAKINTLKLRKLVNLKDSKEVRLSNEMKQRRDVLQLQKEVNILKTQILV